MDLPEAFKTNSRSTRKLKFDFDYQRRQPESFIMKHQQSRHGGGEADFKAKVICSFKDCLSGQIAEGVQIRRSEKEILNTKAEWHQPALWKVRNELCRE